MPGGRTNRETTDKIARQRPDRDKLTGVNKHGERSRRTGYGPSLPPISPAKFHYNKGDDLRLDDVTTS